MSTAIIFRKGLSSLLNSAVIDILAKSTGTDKALNLLKANFTFTAAEIATNFQDSHARALAAISAGIVSPEQKRHFWKTLLESRIEQEFSQHIEQDYLLPFAQQQNLSTEALSKFRQTALEQCKRLAKCTLFQADNVPFTETELASFVTETGTFAITDLVLAQVSIPLDDSVRDFLSYKELLGQAILFFLHENLRNDTRMAGTLEALQREGLILDVREIKSLVQSTEDKLNQAIASKQFGKLADLGPKLENLQKIESVTETHYAQFIAFQDNFADWTDLVRVQLSDILAAMGDLYWKLDVIHEDVKKILAIVKQLMTSADLAPQMKPRDEFTQYNSGSLDLINQALRLSKNLPDAQFSCVAIGLGSVVSASGDLDKAESLLLKAHQQAQTDDDRALSAFNLFQVQLRHQAYDKALPYLQEAIGFNPQRYALHDVHKYPIERILGAGGMGCVLLCRRRLNETEKVVVKCFWETRKGSLDEIFQEPLLMAKVAGEYVPAPLDYGFVDQENQERGFFVTEYCDGAVDGEEWLKAHGNLDVSSGIAVGLQVAKALQLAHSKGVFHLDLKPANLLFSESETVPSVKVIDFGLAKVAKSLQQELSLRQSRTGLSVLAQSVFGTFDYAPPEQQGYGGVPDAKSDVFAFGKTLYRLLTGEIPQTLHPRRLTKAPKLFELLCDCVEREPEKRPDVRSLIGNLAALSSQPCSTTSVPSKPVKKTNQAEAPRQVDKPRQVDNRIWWNQLNKQWKKVFKKAIGIGGFTVFFKKVIGEDTEPSNGELVKIVQLQKLDCRGTLPLLLPNSLFTKISDLEPLRQLSSLQELYCSSNLISDLEPLRQLSSLQVLSCDSNQISDLEPLRQLTNLQNLYCSSNQISDLEPLSQLTNLQNLNCSSNQISDLEPLSQLTNLQNLYCSSNQISDLEPLFQLTNLQNLDCSSNQISGLELLSQLSNLSNLQFLSCYSSQISDLEPLSQLTNLQNLNCYSNQISDLEPLSQLTNLQNLDCSSNQISDLEPLSQLTNLQQLYCSSNQISDLESLSQLTNLQQLYCSSNQISDLESLRKLLSLQYLDCGDNEIEINSWKMQKFLAEMKMRKCEVST